MAEAATSLRAGAATAARCVRLGEGVVAARRLLQLLARGPRGRGRGALASLPGRRRVAVLGDMLELGPDRARAPPRARAARSPAAWTSVVGRRPARRRRSSRARARRASPRGSLHHFATAADAAAALAGLVRPGDAVLVKASRGVRLEAVVDALAARFGEGEA